ncbi:MAG: cytochrome c [Gemmataceae bacterium]
MFQAGRGGNWVWGALLLLGPLGLGPLGTVGCDYSVRYPAELRYPVRKDLLVIKPSGDQPEMLPSPGLLDQSIRDGLTREENGKRLPKEGVVFYDPSQLTPEQIKAVRRGLDALFGTPLRPRVESDKLATLDELLLTTDRLAAGSELYRKHCMHCHGVAGDGRGPTAPWVHPHPRDYRSGKFKFVSNSSQNAAGEALDVKPSRADLRRILLRGIEGTSMPGFETMPSEQMDHVISYVLHLSIRGEVEFRTLTQILSGKLDGEEAIARFMQETLDGSDFRPGVLDAWAIMNRPEQQLPVPEYPEKYTGPDKDKERAESIRRGFATFTGKEAGCISCHNDFGRQSKYLYDAWGTLVLPRNLTVPVYRGGRRPVDLYYRIRGGILPSGMAVAAFKIKDEKGQDTQTEDAEKYWDLVHFVEALPYPNMLPPEVRERVYGAALNPNPAQPPSRPDRPGPPQVTPGSKQP